ncbi:MAG: hypothetical protein P1S46_06195 [bacterium]|nr:hypothetical protein [bacterium]
MCLMTSCDQCDHYDNWRGEEICIMEHRGLADADQDHWMVKRAFREDNPDICPLRKRMQP